MKKFNQVLRFWLPMAVIISALCGLVYLVEQQTLRMGANDPQIQMAEDTAAALTKGASMESVMPTNQANIASSLAPFVIIFDDSGKPVASSALLHDQIPTYPTGVFDYVRKNGEDRVTWQPEPGVRIASVVVAYSGTQNGFIMAGRSLRETEKRVDLVGSYVLFAWIMTMLTSFIVVILIENFLPEK
jgi:hypothetical protein